VFYRDTTHRGIERWHESTPLSIPLVSSGSSFFAGSLQSHM
jgi:hypothetical protein